MGSNRLPRRRRGPDRRNIVFDSSSATPEATLAAARMVLDSGGLAPEDRPILEDLVVAYVEAKRCLDALKARGHKVSLMIDVEFEA